MPAGRPKNTPKNVMEMLQAYIKQMQLKAELNVKIRNSEKEGLTKRLKEARHYRTLEVNKAKRVLYAELNRLMELETKSTEE